MFIQANDKHDIDMNNSWMVGDKEADIQAANAAGINNTIIVKSGHTINERNSNATYIIDSIAQVKEVIAS
jgi:D-glycero-D-manno-heptose 1,7-bisphosphate phosphatase